MFEGFSDRVIDTAGASIRTRVAGQGPAVLLLHGFPQTHAIWRHVAPRLTEHFTVVATDLRGYGGSSKPDGGDHHINYSKRAMARDQIDVMKSLGFDQFQVVGHDRGGRVAHRMALDYPEVVKRLSVLDIVPTATTFQRANKELALANWHWFFLAQPFDLPEHLIGADPEYYLRWTMKGWTKIPDAMPEEMIQEYLRWFRDPAAIHSACEDYRAAATIDLDHDAADRERTVSCPVLALWGALGRVHKLFDVLECWREKASDVRGRALHSGHFVPEEAPEETLTELLDFLER